MPKSRIIEFFSSRINAKNNLPSSSRLHRAIEKKQYEKAEKIICRAHDVTEIHQKNNIGHTPLYRLILENNTLLARQLINKLCKLNHSDNNAELIKSLRLAINIGNKEIAMDLIVNHNRLNLDLSLDDYSTLSPLYLAVQNDLTDIVTLLVEAGGNLAPFFIDQESPIYELIAAKATKTCRYLAQKYSVPENIGYEEFAALNHISNLASEHNMQEFSDIISEKIKIFPTDFFLVSALIAEHYDATKQLVQEISFSENVDYLKIAELAQEKGFGDITDLILKKMANFSYNYNFLNHLDLPVSQEWLIEKMKSLGYKSNDLGVCYGVAHMAMQAMLADDIDLFNKRLALICLLEQDELASLLEKVKEKVRQKQELTEKDSLILSIPAFFEGVELHQQGYLYPELFDPKNKAVEQNYLSTQKLGSVDISHRQP